MHNENYGDYMCKEASSVDSRVQLSVYVFVNMKEMQRMHQCALQEKIVEYRVAHK